MQDNLKNYVWTDDDHIADVFDETKTQPTGENGNQQPRRASSGSSSNFNVRTILISPCYLTVWKNDLLCRICNYDWVNSKLMIELKFCQIGTRQHSSQ